MSGQRICVDLAFSDLMLDQENKSMCKQLGYCWHANIQAATPAHLVLTSMEVRACERGGGDDQGEALHVQCDALLRARPDEGMPCWQDGERS